MKLGEMIHLVIDWAKGVPASFMVNSVQCVHKKIYYEFISGEFDLCRH